MFDRELRPYILSPRGIGVDPEGQTSPKQDHWRRLSLAIRACRGSEEGERVDMPPP
jgi:hypothetical protein